MSQSRNQFAGTLLLIGTVAAIICAILSFQHLRSYPLHEDGVTWVDRNVPGQEKPQVIAAYIVPGGPADRAGVRVGDQLLAIKSFEIRSGLDVPQALWQIPLLGDASYTLRRNGIEFKKSNIYIQAAPRDPAAFYQYGVGLAYLAIRD